jgi:Uma2 family endonuclease
MESLVRNYIEVDECDEEEEIDYPESDGQPMAETDIHRNVTVYFIEALKDYYRNEPDVYVSGNLLVYFSQGDPSAVVAPDCFVVKGVSKKDRRTYRLWEEKKSLDLVIEFTSKKTKFHDLTTKKLIYQDALKVDEYILYDPLGDYLKSPLQGLRLVSGAYKPIELKDGRLYSKVLNLALGIEEGVLRVFNRSTGETLLTPAESAQNRRKAEIKAQRAVKMARLEKEKREKAEKELQKLREELEALKQK